MRSKSTIAISDELRERLKDAGRKGESYEDVIWRLLGHSKEKKK